MWVIVFGKNPVGWNIYLADIIKEKPLDRTVSFEKAKKFNNRHDAEITIEKFQELKHAYVASLAELKNFGGES